MKKTKTRKKIMEVIMIMIIVFIIKSAYGFPPIAAEFHGMVIINNESASVNTSVTAYDTDGNLCGSYIIKNQGYYGLLSCNGDDPDTAKDEGAESGDGITFYINGKAADYSKKVFWSEGSFQEIDLFLDTNYEELLSGSQNNPRADLILGVLFAVIMFLLMFVLNKRMKINKR